MFEHDKSIISHIAYLRNDVTETVDSIKFSIDKVNVGFFFRSWLQPSGSRKMILLLYKAGKRRRERIKKKNKKRYGVCKKKKKK